MSSKTTRQKFLGFFQQLGHEVVPSASLVPDKDPTLLFTNAGMNQFKDVFRGVEKRAIPRATSSQKCVRAGGKHNDLENVGFTSRHHTFFEMLGNFSFGDYFKAEAIGWAYELLVKELGIDPKRMAYTVFGGDPAFPQVAPDEESAALWCKVAGVTSDRVHRLGAKDNFWQMGDVGPMGPCSEIHYFQGDDLPCPEPVCRGVVCECDRWVEIWNLVFMQYERKERNGELIPLPAPSVDTGAGLERVVAVVGGFRSNYQTDLFVPLIERVAELCSRPPGRDSRDDASMRVIADHARATAFLVADGVFPDKTGREYVLRRIIRRAIRHGKRLGIEEPFLHLVCGEVIARMGDVYPELQARAKVISQVALDEETRFRRTLDRGLRLLEEEFERLGREKETVIPGAKVFQLYDTYGFPADLTAVIAAERGLAADMAGFDSAMAVAQERSEFKGQDEAVATVYKELLQEVEPTVFVGYEQEEATATITALLVDGRRQDAASVGAKIAVVCDTTPFYGAAGGQVGDCGTIHAETARIRVSEAIKPVGDLIVHLGEIETGAVRVGERIRLAVDSERRNQIRANHSATHLLHHSLRQVLGEHAVQKGSLVAPDRLRFDFAHFAPLSAPEKRQIEKLVNDEIRRNVASHTEVLPIEEARKRQAMHIFGEKYGQTVRVVRIGADSLEFCGGTHVGRTGNIGFFKIIGEGGIAQGVRRIEALTGSAAVDHVQQLETELTTAAESLRTPAFEVAGRVERLAGENRAKDKEIAELRQKLAGGGARDLLDSVKEIGGVKVLASKTDVVDARVLREIGDKLRDRIGSGIVVLVGANEGKVSILAVVTQDLTKRFHAGKIASAAAEVVGGKGGGRPDMAQAGGHDVGRVDEAIARALAIVSSGTGS
ncbi:MAG: alanine--tRNA ligase [Pseudomonadota bacterium]